MRTEPEEACKEEEKKKEEQEQMEQRPKGRGIEVRGVLIGDGMPKICIPVLGQNEEEIRQSLLQALSAGPDLLEWRADWLLAAKQGGICPIGGILQQIRREAGGIPILFTVRTKKEGGALSVTEEAYGKLLQEALLSPEVDLLDIEFFRGEALVKSLVAAAKEKGVRAVLSNHDFERTPSKEEMVNRLIRMKEAGADFPKIAVMPHDKRDVLALLAATEEACRRCGPVITMSMGATGVLSRMCGEFSGSAVTFAAAKQASAPGQIPAGEMRHILSCIHPYMENIGGKERNLLHGQKNRKI